MRVKEYDVLALAVEQGVAHGWRRAYKHAETEPPGEDAERVKQHITDEVINAVCEWFTFAQEDAE